MNAPSASFDANAYAASLFAFPAISYQDFESVDDLAVRKEIVSRNKLLQTDTYNRTMNFLRAEKGMEKETFTLTFRKSPNGKTNIVYGIRTILKEILSRPITQNELDFAADFYAAQAARGGNSYFDRAMWQRVIDGNGGYLPLKVRAVADGTVLRIGEPVMSVEGPGELAAVFESVFLRVFFQSVVATEMRMIEDILGEGRVVEFGKRSAVNDRAHVDAVEACYVGGGLRGTSNDAAAAVLPQTVSAGTTAHRYLASYRIEDEAFVNAIEKSDRTALLVDLVDTYSGIEKLIELKKSYRATGKSIAIRLDSGDLLDQALYALRRYAEEGLTDPTLDKIVIADISSMDEIARIEREIEVAGFDPKKYIVYGLGGILVAKNKLRDTVSAAYKLTDREDGATGKLSNDIGKQAIPGTLDIELFDGERVIVQSDEPVRGERLMATVYDNGRLGFSETSDVRAVDLAREKVKASVQSVLAPTVLSEKTKSLRDAVRARFLSNVR